MAWSGTWQTSDDSEMVFVGGQGALYTALKRQGLVPLQYSLDDREAPRAAEGPQGLPGAL